MNPYKLRLVSYWKDYGIIKDERLLKAFEVIDREDFVLPEYSQEAYADTPLPIGFDQTISQPTTVMIMIDALNLSKEDVVLEVGTGSGYNAAIMSRLCKKVYSVEIIPGLVKFAKNNLKTAKITNVEVILSDGGAGLKENAPYDKIIVTAASPKIPEALIKQLKEGGIIVIPVGEYSQKMKVGKKISGLLATRSIGDFQFVKLTGKEGF